MATMAGMAERKAEIAEKRRANVARARSFRWKAGEAPTVEPGEMEEL